MARIACPRCSNQSGNAENHCPYRRAGKRAYRHLAVEQSAEKEQRRQSECQQRCRSGGEACSADTIVPSVAGQADVARGPPGCTGESPQSPLDILVTTSQPGRLRKTDPVKRLVPARHWRQKTAFRRKSPRLQLKD